MILKPTAVAFQLFFSDVLVANAARHPRTETGGGNRQMSDAETVRIVNGAHAQALGIDIVRPFGETIFVFSDVNNVPVDDKNLNNAKTGIVAFDGADVARRQIGTCG